MQSLAVFLSLIVFASAQYSCDPGFCSQANGLSRQDVLGCLYYCYLDIDVSTFIDNPELHQRFDEWRGAAETCDLACFIAANSVVVPACETELTGAYNLLESFDNTTEISSDDINSWYNTMVLIQGGEPIDSTSFQTWWAVLYNEVVDPTCALPYP